MRYTLKGWLLMAGIVAHSALQAQTVPSPKQHFGFNIGDDYQLATYTQTAAYFQKLAASDRVKLTDIGLTEEGRHQYMLVISSPANIKQLEQYKKISQQLARAEGLTPEQAKDLSEKGKAVVWIDGGLHATEVVGTHQLIETAWQLISRNDPETMRILDNVIILMTHANPDGQELTSSWYMRNADTLKRSTDQLPVLYQKYIGHDNNRDFYIMNMKESANMGKQLFLEWMPQIMYNHHQRGPEGSVLAGPPYRDPFNYFFDPLMITGIDALGAAMYNRLNVEDKPGYTRLNGSSFSTWYNGGLRTTTQYHNMIGLLTEIIGNPTPEKIPVVPQRLIPNGATPNPVRPTGDWRFRTSIDYSVSLNYAVLDYAARQRDEVLFNIYKMGKNAIDKGNTDSWTLSPKRADAITAAYKKAQNDTTKDDGSDPYGWMRRGSSIGMQYYDAVYKNPAERDPRGYVIPADQPDFATAVRFVNALIKAGIGVQKATAAFTVAGKQYPAGSYIVRTNQAFRPHVLDMFEPQDHPNDFQYPGGPPVRPYDAAGWTLAFQMGVKYDRVLDDFSGPFEKLPYGELQSPSVLSFTPATSGGYLLSAQVNNAFITVNDLMKAGVKVYRLSEGQDGIAPGTFFVPAGAQADNILKTAAAQWGVAAKVVKKRPKGATEAMPLRIALWDNYGGSMPSGWIRWMMEQYHFPFSLVYPKDIDAGTLKEHYDVIVFVTRAIPPVGGEENNRYGYRQTQPEAADIPEQYRKMLGRISKDTSIPQLKAFLEAGGTVITIGSSTNLAYHLGLPVHNALVEKGKDGKEQSLPGTKYFVPGSILQVAFDSTQRAAWGMPAVGDVNFDNSPVFRLDNDAASKGVHPIAWFTTDKPLRSGWAWGQSYLKDGVAAFEASVGKGKLYAFGPEITFRGQSHGTFKLLFNGLYGQK
ncbi:M14 metallopeptidase family protein [Chitinophaga pinensis]|uniref:Peptidase n=1 Tax=Chitinophaga pinensis TaxID=79329 RepID=A0A5C6LZ92_9BACT|nr:M14 metallopeptidase family protein [Chitinophaga pinensis]TWW02152.1 peptidase [Chitinophaga pinensis]